MKEILDRAQALGKQAYTLPAYQVAGRTPLQQLATSLAHKVWCVYTYATAGEKATSAGMQPLKVYWINCCSCLHESISTAVSMR